MEEQTTLTFEGNIQRVVLLTLAVLAVAIAFISGIHYFRHAEPYVRDVLALQGEERRGNAIFQLNCAGCHGTLANGKVGPSLRGVSNRRSQWSLIQQITSGNTPPMPKFQASPKEMADLLSYLKTL